MNVTTTTSADGKSMTITLPDHFTFALHRIFRDIYINVRQPGCEFRIDLGATEYMDSSALGMLLLLNEHAKGLGGSVLIARPRQTIRRVLEIASFDKLFRIES
jgi:HptB-dependent secretion and biofilm anti anti-sigma factor